MELSVIIPTCNRADLLQSLLVAMARQTVSPYRFEVIVVDNGSGDGAGKVVSSVAGSYPFCIKYLQVNTPGLHAARHAGMNNAMSDLLVFADDDIVPTDTWLEGVYEGFAVHGAQMVGGKNLPLWESPPPRWLDEKWRQGDSTGRRVLAYLSVIDLGDEAQFVSPLMVFGCNFSVKRSLLEETLGFHPDAMPDELIHLRGDGESHVSRHMISTGVPAFYHPKASVFHRVTPQRMTFEYFGKRAFNQGISDSFSNLRGVVTRDRPRGIKPRLLARLLNSRVMDRLLRIALPPKRYIDIVTEDAYWRGFDWHQRRVEHDEEMREWVSKPDFLEP